MPGPAAPLILAALILAGARPSASPEEPRHPQEKTVAAADRSSIVGAIRWDAWHGDKGVPGRAVEKSLSPKHWHYRLPFYAKVVGDSQVEVRADSQAIMDLEIEHAAAVLDYWAFGYYHPIGCPMASGLPLYLKSKHKARINFCLWLEDIGPVKDWPETAQTIAGLMKEPTYQLVAGGRPLVYVHCSLTGKFSSREAALEALRVLRAAAAKAGLARPYLVLQSSGNSRDQEFLKTGDFEAIGAYALTAGGEGRQPYAALAAGVERKWDEWRRNGWKVVPLAMAGWDRRPRQESPVPWESGDWTRSTLYYDAPKPEELAGHVRKALEWNRAHPESAEARAVLIYAWNETDEGGWLVPTLSEGSARLEAIGKVLGKKAAEPARPAQ